MKLRTLALTAAIGLTAVAAMQAQDVSGRSLKLRGANTTVANIGTVTVPALTAPRTYTFQDVDGTIALTTGPLSANRFIYTNGSGLIINSGALSDGQLLIGNGAGAPAAATLGVLRGLTVTNGAGTISLGMPTAATTSSVLRFDGANWVESGAPFTVDATGNVASQGDATLGAPLSATGGSLILHDNAAGSSFTGTIQAPAFTADRTIDLPDASGTIIVGTGGTANRLTRFGAGGGSIVDASLSDDGAGTLARAGAINLNPGGANTLATNGSFDVAQNTSLGNDNADITTIRGAINLNTTNTAFATVNINTSAFANTTNIGATGTAGNVINLYTNAAGAGVTVVNANAGGTGLAITDATVNGLTLGTGTPPVTGIRVNSTTNGIIVNSGGGSDLTINEDALTLAGNFAINTGAANTLSTNGRLQVDGAATLGTDAPVAGFLSFHDNTIGNGNTGRFQPVANFTANRTYTLPDNTGTVLLATLATPNRIPRWGASGTSLVDGSLSDNGSGTLSGGNIVTLTSSSTETIIEQTGDVYGTTRLRLQNRDGSNGALFENAALDLVDFGFKPNVGPQGNIRLEHQAAQLADAANAADGEFQFRMNSTIPGATTPLAVGAASLTVNTGAAANLTVAETGFTRVGNIAVNPGAANTVTTNGNLQVDGNTTLGNAITDLVTINGTVRGSEDRLLAAAATNKFSGRIHINGTTDGAGPGYPILNSQVTATSTIIISVMSTTATNYDAAISAQAAGTFTVRIAGVLGLADDLFLNYIIINP